MNSSLSASIKVFQRDAFPFPVKELRWCLFRKKQAQAQSERLSPTQATLSQAIVRARYQLVVWNSDKVANPTLPSPQNVGWTADKNGWVPVITKLPPTPRAINYLVKCKCAQERCLKGLWNASAHVRQLDFYSGEQFFKIGVWWRNPLPSTLRRPRKP